MRRRAFTSSTMSSSIRRAVSDGGAVVLATVGARPWESSDLRPHERTLRGPKADRLALMRATRAQTSPIFAVWTGAGGIATTLDAVATGDALLGGRIDGEIASEKLLLWRVADPEHVASITATLSAAQRSTSLTVTIATRRGGIRGGATRGGAGMPPRTRHSSAASCTSPLPTIRESPSCRRTGWCGPGLASRSASTTCGRGSTTRTRREPAADGRAALAAAASMHGDAPCLCGRRSRRGGRAPAPTARPTARRATASTSRSSKPRCSGPAGVSRDMISGGALAYTRDPDELDAAVRRGEATLAFGVVTGERGGGHRGGGRRGDDAAEVHVLLSESAHRARAFRGVITPAATSRVFGTRSPAGRVEAFNREQGTIDCQPTDTAAHSARLSSRCGSPCATIRVRPVRIAAQPRHGNSSRRGSSSRVPASTRPTAAGRPRRRSPRTAVSRRALRSAKNDGAKSDGAEVRCRKVRLAKSEKKTPVSEGSTTTTKPASTDAAS